jgi:hypothetical protein
MVGRIGLDGPQRQSRTPANRLIESWCALSVFQLRECGALVPGTETTLEIAPGHSCRAIRTAGILTIGRQVIQVRPHRQLAVEVFGCPKCNRDCYRLHFVAGEWRCRLDHPKLDYACRHRNLSIKGYSRALFLRRRLGASPVLFSPVEVSIRSPKRLRLVIELRAIESGLASLGQANARVLEKRHKTRKVLGHP